MIRTNGVFPPNEVEDMSSIELKEYKKKEKEKQRKKWVTPTGDVVIETTVDEKAILRAASEKIIH